MPEDIAHSYRRRRKTLRLAGSFLASWGLAAALLLSFTARAGETAHVVDQAFRRSTMIEARRLTLTPPRMTSLLVVLEKPAQGRDLADGIAASPLLPHIRKVDFARETTLPPSAIAPLAFLSDPRILTSRPLEPTVTLQKATRVLLLRLTRFEGRSIDQSPPSAKSRDLALQGLSPATLAANRPEGTTPAPSRAVMLSSMTPAPVQPEVIAASAMRLPTFAQIQRDQPAGALSVASTALGRDYATLIDPDQRQSEEKCLAEAVYFEARSEPVEGQVAVAQVVLNRVRSRLYPTSICGVVYQNRHRYKACQFTFACEGKALVPREPAAWLLAQRIARDVLEGDRYLEAVGGSTHYHANYVAPYWSRRLKRTDRIGRHIFYTLRPGQT